MISRIENLIREKSAALKRASLRQKWHFMPPTGWMNDPNGLIYFQNQYHAFFQFNPYAAEWGMMHWGHAVSDDLLHWSYCPVALVPDQPYDLHPRGGCFSGTAIEHAGRLYLFYTGVADSGNGLEQTQCLAWSDDGVEFVKYSGNPVVRAPKGFSPKDFRDPKIFKHEDTFYMIVGSTHNGRGAALLFRSEELLNWTYVNVLAESDGTLGEMWECPDFFPLDNIGKYALTFSAVGAPRHVCSCLIGDMDFYLGKLNKTQLSTIDHGYDFYAPQSFESPDGRRIMFAWANGWQWMPWWKDFGGTESEGWCGSFTAPREMRVLEDGTPFFVPVKELIRLRRKEEYTQILLLTEGKCVRIGEEKSFEMDFNLNLRNASACEFVLRMRYGGESYAELRIDLQGKRMHVGRSDIDAVTSRITDCEIPDTDTMHIRILGDVNSIEIFACEGKHVYSINVPSKRCGDKIYAESIGGNLEMMDIHLWCLEL